MSLNLNIAAAQKDVTARNVTGLNAEGINRLIAGDSEGAVQCLKLALTLLCHLLDAPAAAKNHVMHDDTTMECSERRQPWTSVPIPSLEDGAFYVHNQAIFMNMPEVPQLRDFDEAGVVVLFNLALCYHYQGQWSGSAQKLHQACHAYQLCETHVLAHMSEHVPALAFMCQNNEAQIYYRLLGNPTKSLEILESMSIEDLAVAGWLQGMDDNFLAGIWLNATLVPNGPMASPAA